MILISADKLKTPFRRLIFGVSVTDAIASIAYVLQPIMSPEGIVVTDGNRATCEAVAFPVHFEYVASSLYTHWRYVYIIFK